MIEFKAECGHTVRAKDDDAGGNVRCSYCGRSASVPDTRDVPLDSLFDEVQRPHNAADLESRSGRRRPRKSWLRPGRRTGAFNPFPLILRLCYAALLVSIVVVVVRKFILPLWDGARRPPPVATANKEPVKRQREGGQAQPPKTPEKGLLNRGQLAGMYVASTPPGATVYCINASEAPPTGRINRHHGCAMYAPHSELPRLGDGSYVVELVFPWNDQTLKQYKGYTDFRREIEPPAPEAQRRQIVEAYFLPDEAAAVFFDQTDEQKYIVRQYRNVEVRDGRSHGVRGLFLPRIPVDEYRFSIEELVVKYIPETVNYSFDERHLLEELEYYDVTESERPWVLKALARTGVIPYVTQSRRTLMFKIGIEDGVFSAKVVREAGK